jgi:hypothetical protein
LFARAEISETKKEAMIAIVINLNVVIVLYSSMASTGCVRGPLMSVKTICGVSISTRVLRIK